MEDEAYARELLAILTNPSPTGIDPDDPYGQADDGIDRHDGFGRDVWVESLNVADGQSGTELVVEFGLAVPPNPSWQGLPHRGSVRLPFDAQWRRLSGYEQPAAYAPAVARAVELAAHEQVERHRSEAVRSRPGGARRLQPGRPEHWQMLLDGLSGEGEVREVGPGRVEVDIRDEDDPASSDVVTVVVSREQWEQVLAERAGGDADLYVAELLGPRDEDEKFVVFYNGDLVRSTREELPPVRGSAFERRIAEARAKHPGQQGHWSAHFTETGDDPEPPSYN
jgi:hypothetical protein